MSRLFNQIIEEVYSGNPHLYEEMLQAQLDAEYKEFYYLRGEWENGNRTPETHGIEEWERLGKPTRKKDHNLDHIFGDPIKDLDNIVKGLFGE